MKKTEDVKARAKFERVYSDITHSRPNAEAFFWEESSQKLRLRFLLEQHFELSDFLSAYAIFVANFS